VRLRHDLIVATDIRTVGHHQRDATGATCSADPAA